MVALSGEKMNQAGTFFADDASEPATIKHGIVRISKKKQGEIRDELEKARSCPDVGPGSGPEPDSLWKQDVRRHKRTGRKYAGRDAAER